MTRAPIEVLTRCPPRIEGYLDPATVRTLTPKSLAARTAALQPLLAQHAREAERIRKPVDAVWEAIRATGIFYLFVPRVFGGLELGPEEYFDAVLPLSQGDASTGWSAGFCVHHNWLMAHFPRQAQEEFFANGYGLAPGVTVPPAKAVPIEGGYRVSGQWKWGSGVMHADWVLGICLVEGETPPNPLWVAIPAAEVTVLDTWQMTGMAATGSNDVRVEDVFVPAHRTVRQAAISDGTSPGALMHDSPTYRMPIRVFFTFAAAIPALGATKAAVAYFRDYLEKRIVFGTADTKHSDKQAAQMRLGQADQAARAAELLLRDVARKCAGLAKISPIPVAERINLRAQSAYAVELCLQAMRTICAGAGSSAYSLDNPLQRALRDVTVISSHVTFDYDSTMELAGRSLIGLPPNSPLF